MKKLILWGLAGVLGMLLIQSPLDLQAMDSGIIGYSGYHGYNAGPNMMDHQGYQSNGMGPRMMRPTNENGSQWGQNKPYLDIKAADRIFEDYLSSRHDPNLKLGEIKDEGYFYQAALLKKDNSLVADLIVDKADGRLHFAYSERS